MGGGLGTLARPRRGSKQRSSHADAKMPLSSWFSLRRSQPVVPLYDNCGRHLLFSAETPRDPLVTSGPVDAAVSTAEDARPAESPAGAEDSLARTLLDGRLSDSPDGMEAVAEPRHSRRNRRSSFCRAEHRTFNRYASFSPAIAHWELKQRKDEQVRRELWWAPGGAEKKAGCRRD